MIENITVYKAFGQFIYGLTKADGIIQSEEIFMLDTLVRANEGAGEILGSLKEHIYLNSSPLKCVEESISHLSKHSKPELNLEFYEIIKKVAKISQGIDAPENEIINRFKNEVLKLS
jgi:hypothetical protein